jgi:hypothetical protein
MRRVTMRQGLSIPMMMAGSGWIVEANPHSSDGSISPIRGGRALPMLSTRQEGGAVKRELCFKRVIGTRAALTFSRRFLRARGATRALPEPPISFAEFFLQYFDQRVPSGRARRRRRLIGRSPGRSDRRRAPTSRRVAGSTACRRMSRSDDIGCERPTDIVLPGPEPAAWGVAQPGSNPAKAG